MATFIKKAVDVEMVQWTGENLDELEEFARHATPHPSVVAETAITFWCEKAASSATIVLGDWIAKERVGRGFYPILREDQKDSYVPKGVEVHNLAGAEQQLHDLAAGDPVDAVRWLFEGREPLTDDQRLAIFEIVQRATRFD